MLIGPLLARFKKALLPKPGGDKIGRRRLDTHFLGFEKLGAEFQYNDETDQFYIVGDKLRGAYILMDEISVTGTANVLMAAVLAEGRLGAMRCRRHEMRRVATATMPLGPASSLTR